jgi:hypothetical protein
MKTRKNNIKSRMKVVTRKKRITGTKPEYSVIIAASRIKSNPSIEFIKCTIESLKHIHMNPDTPIILAHDYSDDIIYKNYLNNLKEYISDKKNIKIVLRKTHGGLSENIRNVLKYIHTDYMLVIQHDFPFIRDFEIEKIIEDMNHNPELKHVRFNKRANIKFGAESLNNLFGKQVKSTNYTYTMTPGWSDNNHLCRTDYYRNIIMKECKRASCMEGRLMFKQKTMKLHNKYGTYLFGKIKEHAYIYHADGALKDRICCPNSRNGCYTANKNGRLLNKNHKYIT